ncbi:four-helix bundle copper-binding protein [Jeotgalibacillus soli]|uniref:Ferredoxin n=1 Tax=Jeotgalibacillus soli TaxID=889306 RepID=A0A0C2S5W3_9BACL|nr:four-helix bundle copper-binding protein [Jeotgalibacillus soli]KIL49434.1 hypothetical protein KP78_09020 [Jeotgalibacillus soli]
MQLQTQYEKCIEACLECLEACNYCFRSCLEEEDVSMMTGCIRLDRECADACQLAITAMQTNSPHVKEICQLVATICAACADECAKHDHEHCKQCAEACRNCAEACEEMVASLN